MVVEAKALSTRVDSTHMNGGTSAFATILSEIATSELNGSCREFRFLFRKIWVEAKSLKWLEDERYLVARAAILKAHQERTRERELPINFKDALCGT
jgi:hypothetical protein